MEAGEGLQGLPEIARLHAQFGNLIQGGKDTGFTFATQTRSVADSFCIA